ncbi:MAG: M48 family metalloprotease [Elusimicrobia bacterium]|nr:M48 family metalloprotease [Elusimicrobiota bacterium]
MRMEYKNWVIPVSIFFSFALCSAGMALNPQNWKKKLEFQKTRKVTQKSASVAAVRGVEEPGDVDPNLRDFEAVTAMEKRTLLPTQVDQFVQEGQLLSEIKKKEDNKKLAEGLSSLSEQLGNVPIPGTVKAAARPLTTEEEIALGKDVAANVAAQFGIDKNEDRTRYLQLVGLTVARAAARKEITYRFAILDSPILNAFAAPGGYIFVTRGLLAALKNEAQLAAVLGHEIVHVDQKHVVKEIQKSKIAESVIPAYAKASAKQAVWMNQIKEIAIQMLWKGLSREDELESDRIGLDYAAQSGYDAGEFKEVLKMLQDRSTDTSKTKELKFLLSTHPKPEARIRSIEEKSNTLSAGGQKLEERFRNQTKN